MTIATLDQYIASAKQRVVLSKTTTRTTGAVGIGSERYTAEEVAPDGTGIVTLKLQRHPE